MKWDDVGNLNCSVARSLSVMGDRWTMLVLRNAFMAIRRFDDFQANLGVTRHVLADRLTRLVDAGVMKKVAYQDKPPRYEYRLTEMGRDLYPVLLALTSWGDKWLDEDRGAPLEYVHKGCGHKFKPTMVCSECREPLSTHDVVLMAGPGLAAAEAKQA